MLKKELLLQKTRNHKEKNSSGNSTGVSDGGFHSENKAKKNPLKALSRERENSKPEHRINTVTAVCGRLIINSWI